MADTMDSRGALSRRSFLKTTGAAAGAVAAAAMVPALTALAAEDGVTPVEEQVFWNKCRGNCGSNSCRLRATVREGKVVQVRPAEVDFDHPYYKTGCVKGQVNPQRMYSTRRVLYPLKRVGERGSGEFERISWDEAIALAADEFERATAAHGPTAAGIWQSYGGGGILGGVGWYFPSASPTAPKLGMGRFVSKTGCTVICPAADLCQMWMNVNLSLPSASPVDMLKSKTIIFWAYNLTETSRDSWQYAMEAKAAGAKLISINPHFNATSAGSDLWLPIRPATDGFLMLAMANYIVDNHLEDEEYLRAKTVAPFLVKEDGSYLRMSDVGVAPTEGPISKTTGKPTVVDPEVVWDEEAGTYGASGTVASPAIHGSFEVNGIPVKTTLDLVLDGIREYTVDKAVEVCDLPKKKIVEVAETYATNRPAGICSYQGVGHHYNSRHNYKNLNLLAALTGNADTPGAFNNINPLNETGVLQGGSDLTELMKVEGGKTPGAYFTSQYLPEIMDTGGLGGKDIPLKWVMVVSANPLASESGRQELIRAMHKLDFLVVADPYLSDTALHADLVLPVALSWETLDADGGYALLDKAVEPAGECKTMMDIYRLLAAGLGYDDLYPYSDEEYIRRALDTPANRKNGFTYDDYRRDGFIRKFSEGAVNQMMGSSYASSRLKFYVEHMPSKEKNGVELDQDIERRPYWEPSIECSVDNPLFQKYPLFALSNHHNYFAHSMITSCEWLDQLRPEPELIISESAAIQRGISQGDYVRAFNDRGECVLRAVVSRGLRPDTVILPHGWQSYDYVRGHHQDLTRVDMDPVTGNSAFYEILCEVEKWNGDEA